MTNIKRHPALQPLSRDHLVALLHSYRLVQAASGNERFELQKCIHDFKDAWKKEIAIHFADEERLFPDLQINAAMLQRLFEDHAELRSLVLELYFDGSKSTARKLGERLEKHVRWEEHELFPEIENNWSPEELHDLEIAAEQIEHSRDRTHPTDT